MDFDKAEQILEKAEQLFGLLDTDGDTLDDLQKAQVLQGLIQAKAAVITLVKDDEDENKDQPSFKDLVGKLNALEKKTQEYAVSLNLPKVQHALDHLSEGVAELLKRKENGEKVVKE